MGKVPRGRGIFGLGFLAGLFFTLYLRSEEGKRLRRDLQVRANDWGEELGEQWRESVGPLAEQLDELTDDTERIAGEVAAAVQEEAEKSGRVARGMWAEWRASFRRGMERAKAREEADG